MVKGTIRRHALGAALALLLPPLCLSCGEDGTSPVGTGGGGDGTVTIGLTLTASYGYDETGKYETGSDYENYIDVAGGDYRIYFFTDTATDTQDGSFSGDDTFIAEFEGFDLVPVTGTGYTEYSVMGKVPDALLEHGNFKVVMLANWGGNYPEVEADVTTISSVCEAESATYGAFVDGSGNALMPSKSQTIPFFGVNTYDGVEFTPGEATILSEPLTLLRAMAKVEVVLADDYYTALDGVSIHRYNAKGCCAPVMVYKRSDYDSGYTDYDKDFWSDLHLVGDKNDGGGTPEEKEIAFQKTREYAGNSTYETWTAYLPEYSNNTNEDDYSYIEVTLEGISYNIYFANYKDGQTDNAYDSGEGDRYDIHRNNLYRFTVAMSSGTFNVHVNKWEKVWENNFSYDDTISGSDD